MNTSRLIICGADNVNTYSSNNVTHILTVANPGAPVIRPAWFTGEHLVMYFGDVISEVDAVQYKTKAPTIEDVKEAVEFVTQAWQSDTSNVLVHCDYGASRSPALAYVAIASELGQGMEEVALQRVLEIQSDAVPNALVVRLGDSLLGRHGALLCPLNKLYAVLDAEISLLMPQ